MGECEEPSSFDLLHNVKGLYHLPGTERPNQEPQVPESYFKKMLH